MLIFHLSDFHIRDERRAEYENIFNKTIKEITTRKNKKALIVITGDIFHNKNKYEGSDINGACDFLRKLQKIAPVILMAGNHDIARNGATDLITPVLENGKNLDTITYYKNSGIYDYDNIRFIVISRLDRVNPADIVEEWRRDKEGSKNKYNILLIHENVIGAKVVFSDSCQIMSDYGRIGDDIIEQFDYIMAGHIHDYQEFGSRRQGAYSGALFQQDIGESKDKGFLIWNLETREREFIKIKNDFGFVRIDENDLRDEILDLPKNIHKLVIEHKGEIDLDLKKIKTDIEARRSVKIKQIYAVAKIERASPREAPGLMSDINEYIKYILIDKDAGYVDKILMFHANVEARMGRNITAVQSLRAAAKKWQLKKLCWSNLFCYGEKNEINFENLPENIISGIISDNRTGKSSVIDIIIYGLYNKVMRGYVADVVRHSVSEGTLTIYIDAGGQNIEIHRICKERGRVEIKINGILQEGRDILDTYKFLKDKIGSFEDLQRTCMITQEDRVKHDFVWSSKKDRYATLSAFFQLEDVVKAGEEVKGERDLAIKHLARDLGIQNIRTISERVLKEIDERLKENENRNNNLVQENERIRREIEESNDKIIEMQKKRDDLNDEIQKITISIVKIDKDLMNKHGMTGKSMSELELIRANIGEVAQDIEEKKVRLAEIQKKIKKIKGIDEEMSRIQQLLISCGLRGKDDIARFNVEGLAKIDKLRQKLAENEINDSKWWVHMKFKHGCSECDYNKKLCIRTNGLGRDETRVELENAEATAAAIEEFNKIKLQWIHYKELLDEESILNNEVRRATDIEEMRALFKSIDDQLKKMEKITELRAAIKDIDAQIMGIHPGQLKINYNQNYTKMLELARINNNALQVIENYTLSMTYMDCMNIRTGIPGMLLKTYLTTLVRDANEILTVADCGFSIAYAEDDGIEIYIEDIIRKTRLPLEMGSGFQKFIISIAIRVCMFSLFPRPVGDFLIIDEGFSCADERNISKMYSFLGEIKKKFKFMILITHLDTLQGVIEAPINIYVDPLSNLSSIGGSDRHINNARISENF